MDALAEEFKEIERELEASLAMLHQGRRPKFVASKNYLENLREWYSETKDKFLLIFEVLDNAYVFLQKEIEEVKDLVHGNEVNKDDYNHTLLTLALVNVLASIIIWHWHRG